MPIPPKPLPDPLSLDLLREVSGDLSIIRTETALSRFPVHRIARKGNVSIELKNQASAVLWRVSYNSEYGQPGPLAYKLDTLIVNRKIDESERPIPKLLRLGSLREICELLGLGDGGSLTHVKNALLQNASTFIRAKVSYRTQNQEERSLEAGFTRYSVVFTGETLPDGRHADAVYLILNEIYLEVLNSAVYRPLDYEYMKELPPAAQRFYEVVSYQIFAALLHRPKNAGRAMPRARLRYSDYCLLSTQMRYSTFDQVKKQMFKVHKPHTASGYLARVQYEETVDEDGQLDWIMHYIPGPKAEAEYQRATGRQPRALLIPAESLASTRLTKRGHKGQGATEEAGQGSLTLEIDEPTGSPVESTIEADHSAALIQRLVAEGLNRADAQRFTRNNPQECERQLAYLPHVSEFTSSRGAYLRSAIERGFGPPAGYQKKEEERQARLKRQELAALRKASLEAQEAQRAPSDADIDTQLIRLENEEPDAYQIFQAFFEAERKKNRDRFGRAKGVVYEKIVAVWDTPEKRRSVFMEWQSQRQET